MGTTPKNRAQGPDWSRWDIKAIDFQKVNKMVNGYKRGDFGIMKLTEGDPKTNDQVNGVISGVDETAAEQWQLVNQVEIRGAYHFQRSGKSWQAQADHFLKQIEERKYDFHMYALDVEQKRNTYSDAFFQDTRRIIDYWRTAAPGKMVMLYSNVSTYQDYLYPAMQRLYPADGVTWLAGVPLWLAYYYRKNPMGLGEPKTPKQRSAWDIWQYSPNGARNNYGARDLNVFRDTKEAMKAWLGI